MGGKSTREWRKRGREREMETLLQDLNERIKELKVLSLIRCEGECLGVCTATHMSSPHCFFRGENPFVGGPCMHVEGEHPSLCALVVVC